MSIISIFKALSDETRLRLFNLLVDNELNVNEIVEVMAMGQSRISRHLKILSSSGLLTSRRDGLWTFYKAVNGDEANELIQSIIANIKTEKFYINDLESMQQKLSDLQQQKENYFDSIASKLDAVKYDIIGEDVISKQILSFMKKSEVTADLGCGTGDLIPFLKKKSKSIIGIDRSMKMLDVAREKYKQVEDSVDLRIGEIEYLPMKDSEVDCAVINMVFHYLPSPESGIKECGRILKPGGQLIIVDLVKHNDEQLRSRFGHRWLGFSPDEINGWLENEKFTIEKEKTLLAKNKLKIIVISATRN